VFSGVFSQLCADEKRMTPENVPVVGGAFRQGERDMRIGIMTSALAVAVCAGSALADISTVNGYRVEARVFNDFASSNLTINGTSYNGAPSGGAIVGPGSVLFQETFAQGTTGNFANKHLAYLSTNAGATPYGHVFGQSFSLNFTARINSGISTEPRKEGMLQIENVRPGFTDNGSVLLGSEGEVAIFGGAMPFFSCRVPSSAGVGAVGVTGVDWYTPGTTATVSFSYFAPGVVDPTLGAYRLDFTDSVNGFRSSGLKVWGVEGDGVNGFMGGTRFAFQAQNQRNPAIADSSTMEYGNISIVPAPGAAALLGVAGLLAARRRR
jgi:hypothetical protein